MQLPLSFIFYLTFFTLRSFKSNSCSVLTSVLESCFLILISTESKSYLNFPNYLETSANMPFSYSFILSHPFIQQVNTEYMLYAKKVVVIIVSIEAQSLLRLAVIHKERLTYFFPWLKLNITYRPRTDF